MGTLSNYQEVVKSTAKSCETQELDGPTLNLLHWALGLAGETGELVDPVKKYVFYNQPLDMVNIQEELGDILYYLAAFADEVGLSLDYIMENNVAKLKQRYPNGYSDEDAKARADKKDGE